MTEIYFLRLRTSSELWISVCEHEIDRVLNATLQKEKYSCKKYSENICKRNTQFTYKI